MTVPSALIHRRSKPSSTNIFYLRHCRQYSSVQSRRRNWWLLLRCLLHLQLIILLKEKCFTSASNEMFNPIASLAHANKHDIGSFRQSTLTNVKRRHTQCNYPRRINRDSSRFVSGNGVKLFPRHPTVCYILFWGKPHSPQLVEEYSRLLIQNPSSEPIRNTDLKGRAINQRCTAAKSYQKSLTQVHFRWYHCIWTNHDIRRVMNEQHKRFLAVKALTTEDLVFENAHIVVNHGKQRHSPSLLCLFRLIRSDDFYVIYRSG